MLKFFHIARISNFRIFLKDLSLDFKYIIFSYLDELMTFLIYGCKALNV